RARSSRPSSGTTASSLAWSARSSKHTRGRSSGSARGRARAGVSKTVQDNELKLAILALGQRVMDAIAERQRDEADLIGRYRDAVRKITETVEVGGEALPIERDVVGLDERVEIAGKFLRMVQRRDSDYEATITGAL